MNNFLTIENLLNVAKLLKEHYLDYDILVVIDKFGNRLLKFAHKTLFCDFEVVLINNFDVKLNKRYGKIDIKLFKRYFRAAMCEVCGQDYEDALKNYIKYDSPVKIGV